MLQLCRTDVPQKKRSRFPSEAGGALVVLGFVPGLADAVGSLLVPRARVAACAYVALSGMTGGLRGWRGGVS